MTVEAAYAEVERITRRKARNCSSSVVVSGTKITMQSPHMVGFTQDRRPYEVNAKTAMQDVTNPNFIELETLKAKVEMEDKSIVTMKCGDKLCEIIIRDAGAQLSV